MSLLAQVNQPNAQGYYFSLEGSGSGSSSSQYTATGSAGAGGFISTGAGANVNLNNGSFVSRVDTTAIPAGAEVLVLQNDTDPSLKRWGLGYAPGSETGVGNAGANFAINSYADNGSPLGTPLSINRATGVVTATGLLPVPTLSQLQSANITGAVVPVGNTNYPMGTFVPPKTGLYLFTAGFYMNVGGVLFEDCEIGVSDNVYVAISGIGLPNVAIDMKPWTMPTTGALNGQDYTIFSTVPLLLTQGVTYTIQGGTVNATVPSLMRFPIPGGGVGAFFTSAIVSLC